MHGVLNFLKPPGMTSHDAVAFVRRVLKTKRVGHTGTLDPAAAGVLPICVGQATRLVENLQGGVKEYLAEATFGYQTDTLDQCGEVVRTAEAADLTLEKLESVLDAFRGEITQTPPMHSAIKIDGQRLYDLAREGKTVEIPSRQITISKLQVERWVGDEQPKALIRVECSGGTYIRSLVRDIGEALNSAATMTFLTRTRNGAFTIEEALTPQEFESSRTLIELETVLHWQATHSVEDDEAAFAFWQGKLVPSPGSDKNLADNPTVLVHNSAKTLFALTVPAEKVGFYKSEKVFDLREG